MEWLAGHRKKETRTRSAQLDELNWYKTLSLAQKQHLQIQVSFNSRGQPLLQHILFSTAGSSLIQSKQGHLKGIKDIVHLKKDIVHLKKVNIQSFI